LYKKISVNISFCSLSSGSSGNCYYLGNEFHGILIDAGISATTIRKILNKLDLSLQNIMGILVTHNHIDHIRGLEVLNRRYSVPAFTSPNVKASILFQDKKIRPDFIHLIPVRKEFHLAGFDIVAFPVFHDAPETLGFSISAGNKKIVIVTDLGHICDTAASYIKDANLLVIESNYDEQMLENGKYPHFLKARIRSDNGHLGNHQTSEFLADIMSDSLNQICLAHLSKNNNTPERAFYTLLQTFSERGIILKADQKVSILPRNNEGDMIKLSD
jgi:phosphoribosyl 1,2-cyclic phosphodiesterase